MAILSSVFDPERIALIGASDKEGSVGRIILTNLLQGNHRKIFPVNPVKKTLFAQPCYPDIASVPEKVDLAVIATPAKGVPGLVEECGRAGVSGVMILSAGFKETGVEGVRLERQIQDIRRRYGMRILGPACLGFVRPKAGLNATFMRTVPPAGNIAFISQSGALGSAILDWAVDEQIGFSMFASLGSMIDVSFGDLIDFLSDDWNTESILIYMEEIGNVRKFLSAARAFAFRKPIVVLRPGRLALKAAVRGLDPGSFSGNDEIYEAAFKRVGVMRVRDIQGLFNAAKVLYSRRLPRGPRLAVVTVAGLEYASSGPGIMATDALIELGGEPSRLSPETVALLKTTLPPHWRESNSVDVLGGTDIARYEKAIDACLQDPGVDGVLVIYVPMNIAGPEDVAKAVISSSKKSGKPIVAAWTGGKQVRNAREVLVANNIPTYATPEIAVRAYVNMFKYKRSLDMLHETPSEVPVCTGRSKQLLREMINQARSEGRDVLNGKESAFFLEDYCLPLSVPGSVQEADYELTLRSKRDKDFGTYILFGMGGKYSEFIRDYAFGLPPLNRTLAKRLMEETKVYRLIQGYGDKTPADLDALEGLLVNFSDLIVDFPEIAEIDIDPLIISEGMPYVHNFKIVLEPKSVENWVLIDYQPQYPHLVFAPYPTRLMENWTLKDGTEVLLRPTKPEDEPLAREFLSSVSEEALRTRFFSGMIRITHEWLVISCDIDYDRRLAIVSEIQQNGKRRIIGVGSLFVNPEINTAEFALLIHDEFQGKGLAHKLLQLIIQQAKEKGLRQIDGLVLSENEKMLSLAKKMGFTSKLDGDTTLIRLNLD